MWLYDSVMSMCIRIWEVERTAVRRGDVGGSGHDTVVGRRKWCERRLNGEAETTEVIFKPQVRANRRQRKNERTIVERGPPCYPRGSTSARLAGPFRS